MWAQMITVRLKDGVDDQLPGLMQQLQAIEQPGSGLIRSTALRDDDDPALFRMLVVFESEEAARVRESDPRRQEGLQDIRATMAELFAGPPEFTNLSVLFES